MASPSIGPPDSLPRPSSEEHQADPSGTGSSRKRKRKTFACITCRRRKLKCDQTWPTCSRCRKSGVACTYGREEDVEDGDAGIVFSAFNRGRHTEVESNRDGIGFPLPREIRKRTGAGDGHPGETAPETMVFKGKGFKTQFYGGTAAISPLIHFPELRDFMSKGLIGGVSLARIHNDVRALRDRTKRNKEVLVLKTSYTDAEILALLPDQGTAMRLARLYFDGFESTYRVLHAPSFWKDFNALSENPGRASTSFLIILLVVLAIGRVIDPEEKNFRYVGPSSTHRERVVEAVAVGSAWLTHHSRKHTTMEFFQVQILLHVARQATSVKKKRAWEDARALIGSAMSAGLHREPSLLGEQITIFEQEMRRRLWATIVELELQASMDRGMIASTAGLRWDCAVVSNINDDELSPDMKTMPQSRKMDECTGGSFLRHAHGSVTLRIALNSTLNDGALQFSHEEILEYEEQITHLLQRIPEWDNPTGNSEQTIAADPLEHVPGSQQNKGSEFQGQPMKVKAVLKIHLLQYLVLLHSVFLINPSSLPIQVYSTVANLNAAISILSHYHDLSLAGSHVHHLLNYNVVRIALNISQTISTSKIFTASPLLKSLIAPAITSLEQALAISQEGVMRQGQGFKEFWYLSAALSVLQLHSPNVPANIDQKQAAVDRVAAIYYRLLGSQEDAWADNIPSVTLPPISNLSGSTPGSTVGLENTPGNLSNGSNSCLAQVGFGQGQLSQETTLLNSYKEPFTTDVAIFDMMDMANWTLADAWNFEF
jgi:hypothetical protein